MLGIMDILFAVARFILRLRYRIQICGQESFKAALKASQEQKLGVLLLPNHPALMDSLIEMSFLYPHFRQRPLMDVIYVKHPLLRGLMRWVRPIVIPDVENLATKVEAEAALSEVLAALRRGENVLLYPAGRVYRKNAENLRANSAVFRIVRELPHVPIVLARLNGLWGSSFGRSSGKAPKLTHVLLKSLGILLANGLFFTPRRNLTITYAFPLDFPRNPQSVQEVNSYLEAFYNALSEKRVFVPYFWWQGKTPLILPEIQRVGTNGEHTGESFRSCESSANQFSSFEQIFSDIAAKLKELRGYDTELHPSMRLAQDLGLDSLLIVELFVWLEDKYGVQFSATNHEFATLEDLVYAIQNPSAKQAFKLHDVPVSWFWRERRQSQSRLSLPQVFYSLPLHQQHLLSAFVLQAQNRMNEAIVADQTAGVLTYKQFLLRVDLLSQLFSSLPECHIGVMLPSSVAATLTVWALLAAGKTPVFINWTTGVRGIEYAVRSLGLSHIVTAQAMLSRLGEQGIDCSHIENIGCRFLLLENLKSSIGKRHKLYALWHSVWRWQKWVRKPLPQHAALLFTSGSESEPKIVPLAHENFLTNIADALLYLPLYEHDAILAILPPFHSFGLLTNVLLPLCVGLRTVYYPNPMHGATLAAHIAQYRVTGFLATPTFLRGMLRHAQSEQLASLTFVITGAEACPNNVRALLKELCPRAELCEGYGITECSPIVSVNKRGEARDYGIGFVLPSLEYRIVHPETYQVLPPNTAGRLLVRGKSVFSGYLSTQEAFICSPFIELEGKLWYDTGDIVCATPEGFLTFIGRLKRFVKIGGEMISLPAIENTLIQAFCAEAESPVLAVEAYELPLEHESFGAQSQLVLFRTMQGPTLEEANACLRQAGYSGVYLLKREMLVDSLPLLGSGKVNYRALRAMLK